jgi:hypothetical protein
MKLIVRPQQYQVGNNPAPLTYGVFLKTDEQFDGIEHWQTEGDDVFVCYSRSPEGASRAIEFLMEEN